jgi:hypothetical protein
MIFLGLRKDRIIIMAPSAKPPIKPAMMPLIVPRESPVAGEAGMEEVVGLVDVVEMEAEDVEDEVGVVVV